MRRADGARRDRLPAADRRARGARGRLARARARPGDRPLAARRRPRARGRGRRRQGRTGHDDRLPGHLRGRRHGPGRAHGDGRGRARQEGGAPHRRLAARRRPYAPAPKHELAGFDVPQHLVLRGRARAPLQPQLELARRQSTFDEVVGGLDESNALCTRRAAASRAATASRATTATASAPTTPCSSSTTPETPYAIDYDYCKGCGICAAECPCGAIEMVPEKI